MIIDNLQADLKKSLLQKSELEVSTLRLLLSEIRNSEIAKGTKSEDQDILNLIQKEIKKRKESATAFKQGQREELAQKEEAEANILLKYLPAQLSDDELTKIVQDAINEVGASSISDMGKVIGVVMAKVNGQADGSRVSSLIKEKLSYQS